MQFRVQIRTPDADNCLMYEELQTKDLTGSRGFFAITLNDGSGLKTDSNSIDFDLLFSNKSSFSFSPSNCASGVAHTYIPGPTDNRRILVYHSENQGAFSLFTSQLINYAPMAIESLSVGGTKANQLLKVADGVNTSQTELNSTSWTNLLALINGTSTQYLKTADPVSQLKGAS